MRDNGIEYNRNWSIRDIRRSNAGVYRQNNPRRENYQNYVWKRSSFVEKEKFGENKAQINASGITRETTKNDGQNGEEVGSMYNIEEDNTIPKFKELNMEPPKSARKKLFGGSLNSENAGELQLENRMKMLEKAELITDNADEEMKGLMEEEIVLDLVQRDKRQLNASEELEDGDKMVVIGLKGDHVVKRRIAKPSFTLKGACSKKRSVQILTSPRKKITTSKPAGQVEGRNTKKAKVDTRSKDGPPLKEKYDN